MTICCAEADVRTQVWSCGGGVQSAAIGALIVQGRLPKPDLAVIADTERERSATWQYFDAVLKPELSRVGVEIVRVPKSEHATVDLWGGADGDSLLIPAFVSGGKSPGFCSNEWKSRVVDRWCRSLGVRKADVILWLGISLDEMRRVRVGSYRYPLIYDVPMRREGCVKVVRDIGWPDAPRSACWMCPNGDNREWRRIRDEWPEDWQKALELERKIRAKDPRITLHRSGLTLDLAPIDEVDTGQLSLGDQCAGMCWV